MAAGEEDGADIYTVVVNDEDQYSIWPQHKDIPTGWRSAGKEGRKDECLKYIEEVWTDLRPLSLRRAMEAARKK
jgi:MbtH protein